MLDSEARFFQYSIASKVGLLRTLGFKDEEISNPENFQLLQNCLYLAEKSSMLADSRPWELNAVTGKVNSPRVNQQLENYRSNGLEGFNIPTFHKPSLGKVLSALDEVRDSSDPLTLEALSIYALSEGFMERNQLIKHLGKYNLTSPSELLIDLVQLRMATERVDRLGLFSLTNSYFI